MEIVPFQHEAAADQQMESRLFQIGPHMQRIRQSPRSSGSLQPLQRCCQDVEEEPPAGHEALGEVSTLNHAVLTVINGSKTKDCPTLCGIVAQGGGGGADKS